MLLRPESTYRTRGPGNTIAAFRLVLWLTWRPPGPGELACHLGCDHHRCLNPAHGRWGTHKENWLEAALLGTFKEALAEQPEEERQAFTRENHPTLHLLARQGFAWTG